MPENHKVSVAWQIVFTFLPVVNFWAFYRIRKLRKYLLYVFVPSVVLIIIIFAYVYGSGVFLRPAWANTNDPDNTMPLGGPVYEPYDFVTPGPIVSTIGSIIGLGLQGFAIYLVIIWSRQHNRFDTPPPTQPLE
ncbi:MAG: hypothetical protein ACREBU_13930 [Nitrososphaera sp.]